MLVMCRVLLVHENLDHSTELIRRERWIRLRLRHDLLQAPFNPYTPGRSIVPEIGIEVLEELSQITAAPVFEIGDPARPFRRIAANHVRDLRECTPFEFHHRPLDRRRSVRYSLPFPRIIRNSQPSRVHSALIEKVWRPAESS